MKQPEKRGNWYLLTGLLIGLGLGLLYAWWINPVQYIDTEPASMAADYKDEYRKVIALAYQANQDIGRARTRAALIDPQNPSREMAAQAQRLLSNNLSPREARALAVLASDLGQPAPVANSGTVSSTVSNTAVANVSSLPSETLAASQDASLPTATPDLAQAVQTATLPRPSATPTSTLTPMPTFTPRPTATPPRVQDSIFGLTDEQASCDAGVQSGLLQVEVLDKSGSPLPGVRIVIISPSGEETFYTGLSPEISPGYADFQMTPGVSYTIKVGDTSQPVEDISTKSGCSVRLVFTQSQ